MPRKSVQVKKPVRKSVQTKTRRVKKQPIKFSGYKTYNFADHDPILDKLVTVMQDGDLTWKEVQERSGVSPTTILNYVHKLTKRPRFTTLAAVFAVYGLELVPTNMATAKVIPLRPR